MNREEPELYDGAPGELFAAYLDFYRRTAIEKVGDLSEDDQRDSRLPSGWTPLGMLWHLSSMERRWMVWGFLGEDVAEPWRDSHPDDEGWVVPDGFTVDQAADELEAVGRRTTEALAAHALDTVAPAGPRFEGDPPRLAWICFHVLQEYARHVGHLDVAAELAGGPLGE